MSMINVGRGWSFPLRRDPSTGRPKFSSEEDRIFESMHSIIMTDVEERPHMVRNGVPYGTRINRSLFAGAQTVADVAVYDVRRALAVWEPRIIVTDVTGTITKINGMTGVVVGVKFIYRSDNRRDVKLFPITGVSDE